MLFKVLFAILFVVLLIIGAVLGGISLYKASEVTTSGYNWSDSDKATARASRRKLTNRGIAGLIFAGISLFLFILVPWNFHQVESGEIAVVRHMGKIEGVRESGVHFDFWMTNTYEKYDTKVRQIDITTAAYSNDKQPMDIQMTVQYRVNKDKVKDIAITYGNLSALESRIQSVTIERTKSCLSGYGADKIIETRGNISMEVAQIVEDAIGDNFYVDITTVALTNIDFSDSYEQKVEETMAAEQEIKKAEAEAKKAIAIAEGELQVAIKNAQARIEAAKADAEAQRLVAQAEATALKLKSVEMARALGFEILEIEVQGALIVDEEGNPVLDENNNEQYETLIEYEINFDNVAPEKINLLKSYMEYIEYLSKWNGELPDTLVGDGVEVILPSK